MFTTFQISGDGLTSVAAPVVRRRTATGCLTCRARKKKCDEQKPVCKRCQKWPSLRCAWQQRRDETLRLTGVREQDTSYPPAQRLKDLQRMLASAPAQSRMSMLTQPTDSYLSDTMSLVSCFAELHFEPYAAGLFALTESYISSVHWPTLVHAYAACGAAIRSRQDDSWLDLSLSHYADALQMLTICLEQPEEDIVEECILAVVNALHIFETLRHDYRAPNCVHLMAGIHLYSKFINAGPSSTRTARLMIEEFAFQLSISSTFQPLVFGDGDRYGILDQLGTVLRTQRAFERSLLMPAIFDDLETCHDLLVFVYCLSFLRTKVPLQGGHLQEALRITTELETRNRLSASVQPRMPPTPMSSDTSMAVAQLFMVGCLILGAKVIDPAITAESPNVRSHVQQGLIALSHLNSHHTSLVVWPLFMIGTAAITEKERFACLRPLQHLLDDKGIGCMRNVLELLDKAWAPAQQPLGQRSLGLEIVFMDELLSQVIF